MPKRKPDVIQCPSCNSLRVNRCKRKCCVCGIPLIYVGEYVFEEVENGYIYLPSRNHWMLIKEFLDEQRRAGKIR